MELFNLSHRIKLGSANAKCKNGVTLGRKTEHSGGKKINNSKRFKYFNHIEIVSEKMKPHIVKF